jgi:RimJ/RimL family protein N-acetyltransferase
MLVHVHAVEVVMPAIPELTTERLLLRAFAPEDAGRVSDLLGRREMAETTLTIPYPYPAGHAAAWIGKVTERAHGGVAFTWAICRGEDRVLMGSIMIYLDPPWPRGELGYWIGVPYWNRGYMTEAVREVIAYGFGALPLRRIQATAYPRNASSSRVLEKAGLRYEGTLRGYYVKHHIDEDVRMYAILRDHWRQATGA